MRVRKSPPVPVYLSPRHLLEENLDDCGADFAAGVGAVVDWNGPCLLSW